jgi:hypothetical protein
VQDVSGVRVVADRQPALAVRAVFELPPHLIWTESRLVTHSGCFHGRTRRLRTFAAGLGTVPTSIPAHECGWNYMQSFLRHIAPVLIRFLTAISRREIRSTT